MKLDLRRAAALIFFCVGGMVNAFTYAAETTDIKAIPFKQASSHSAGDPYRIIVGFAICMLVLVVVIYGLRRKLNSARTLGGVKKQLRVMETQRLGTHSRLHVVEFAGKRYFLAQTEHRINRIAEAPLSDAIDAKTEAVE